MRSRRLSGTVEVQTVNMSLQPAMLLLAALSLFAAAWGQLNQGVRLASSPLGKHAGRVEVKYNGRWGTICDNGWSTYDGTVICSMLNFPGYICAVRAGTGVFGEGTGPVWLNNLRCGYREVTLDNCGNSNPLNTNPCAHNRDAALICQDNTVMPVPYDVKQINQTTRTITLEWKLASIPPYIRAIDFWLNITGVNYFYGPRRILYHTAVILSSRNFTYTLRGLKFNTTYTVDIKADGEYQWCNINELLGNNSETITIMTADSVPPSTLPMRLLTVEGANTPYIGRLQVYHDGTWGHVCNDFFGIDEANLACMGLNYTDGAVCYATSVFPRSAGPMWLDDVDCTYADRFQDCTHRGWGVHNCFGSLDSIGLVCNPGTSGVPMVTGLRASQISHTAITVQWNPVSNIGRYVLQYGIVGGRTSYIYLRPPTTQYTLSRLTLGFNYTINISAGIDFRTYRGGNCYQYLYGEYSDPIYAETRENVPTVAITSFHVNVLNSTAVEVTWRPPASTIGINGEIRGFKLLVDKINGNLTTINITNQLTRVYIVTNLQTSATYLFSILIFTIGDGPQSVRLQVTMPDGSFNPLIAKFGAYGNGVEVVTKYTYQLGFNVLCGSDVNDAVFYWRFANGSRIGITNPGFRGAQFANGTAVLQIGTALPYTRRLQLCDGGLYTCVATHPNGSIVTRNFSLQIGSSQPAVNQPSLIRKGASWVQVAWNPVYCDAGFQINSYSVEYRLRRTYYFYGPFQTAGTVAALNFTIHGLSPNTQYDFRVGTISATTSSVVYSRIFSVITQVAGPSPPRTVVVRVGYNSEVCATWRTPATPVGEVVLYRLYAEIVESSSDIVDAIDLPTGTLVKTFPGSLTSGCMTLNPSGVIYHFQMSAVAVVNGERLEGTLSSVTAESTVYVPKPGVPRPVNVQESATNTSVTLEWELPENVELSDSYFNVSYSGVVSWTSNEGVYISFLESGQATVDNISLTISPLTPSTTYAFRIAMIKPQEGKGEEVSVSVTTDTEVGDKVAYFQIRIQLHDEICGEWISEDTQTKLEAIKQSLKAALVSQCRCTITTAIISQGEFSCRTGPVDTVTFRARIAGTPFLSASDMVGLVRSWVEGGQASIKLGTSRNSIDPTCTANLDNIHAPDCEVVETTPMPTENTTIGVPRPVNVQGSATNTSVTLEWELPENVELSDSYFNVSYSGVVSWTSNEGVYISFLESGQATADDFSLTISPLTPSTTYAFRIAMIKPQEGKGEEVSVSVTTDTEVGDKVAYFQIRIQLHDEICGEWISEDTQTKLEAIKQSLKAALVSQCRCTITTAIISQGEFSCRTGPVDTVTFRARIAGTPFLSASDMVGLVRSWVEGGQASIKLGTSRLSIDPACTANLDNIHAPDCEVVETITMPTENTTDKTNEGTENEKDANSATGRVEGNDENDNSNNKTSSGEVFGILVGGLIVGLMLALLIALIIIIVMWMKKQRAQSFKVQSEFNELVDEPHAQSSIVSDDKL